MAELGDRRLKAIAHGVHVEGEIPELIARAKNERMREVSGSDAARFLGEGPNRRADEPLTPHEGEQRAQHGERARGERRVAEDAANEAPLHARRLGQLDGSLTLTIDVERHERVEV